MSREKENERERKGERTSGRKERKWINGWQGEKSEWANAMNERERVSRSGRKKREEASVEEREWESTKEARRHTGSPRFRTHAGRLAGRSADQSASERFAPINAERRGALIDRAFECFSRCQSGDICSHDATSFRGSAPPPRTWPRITRKSAPRGAREGTSGTRVRAAERNRTGARTLAMIPRDLGLFRECQWGERIDGWTGIRVYTRATRVRVGPPSPVRTTSDRIVWRKKSSEDRQVVVLGPVASPGSLWWSSASLRIQCVYEREGERERDWAEPRVASVQRESRGNPEYKITI